jgi:hypothetical protein
LRTVVVEEQIRSPRDGERYSLTSQRDSLTNQIACASHQFRQSDAAHPEEKLQLEFDDPARRI